MFKIDDECVIASSSTRVVGDPGVKPVTHAQINLFTHKKMADILNLAFLMQEQ